MKVCGRLGVDGYNRGRCQAVSGREGDMILRFAVCFTLKIVSSGYMPCNAGDWTDGDFVERGVE